MRTIIGSSGRACAIFFGSKAGRFESNLFRVSQYDPNLHTGEELIQY